MLWKCFVNILLYFFVYLLFEIKSHGNHSDWPHIHNVDQIVLEVIHILLFWPHKFKRKSAPISPNFNRIWGKNPILNWSTLFTACLPSFFLTWKFYFHVFDCLFFLRAHWWFVGINDFLFCILKLVFNWFIET